MKKIYKAKICRVCNEPTKQIFNINFKKAYICKHCEYLIVEQSVMDVYKEIEIKIPRMTKKEFDKLNK